MWGDGPYGGRCSELSVLAYFMRKCEERVIPRKRENPNETMGSAPAG